jgi:hypothetical protein
MHVQEARANIKSSTITDVKLGVLVSGPGADRAYLRYARDSRPLFDVYTRFYFYTRSLVRIDYLQVSHAEEDTVCHMRRRIHACY